LISFAVWAAFSAAMVIGGYNIGAFGDAFGGLTALFSGAAFIAFWYALILQSKELEMQREEIRLMREIQQESLGLEEAKLKPTFSISLAPHEHMPNDDFFSNNLLAPSERFETLRENQDKYEVFHVVRKVLENPCMVVSIRAGPAGVLVSRSSISDHLEIDNQFLFFLLCPKANPTSQISINYTTKLGQRRFCRVLVVGHGLLQEDHSEHTRFFE
jgi:hypothetical protein